MMPSMLFAVVSLWRIAAGWMDRDHSLAAVMQPRAQ